MLARLTLALLVGVLAFAVAASASAAVKPLHVRNGALVDQKGRTVILHGVNVVYKRSPYLPFGKAERDSFNAKDVRRLRSWGFNTVRFGLSWKALMPTPGVVDQGYLKRALAITRLMEDAGLYYLLDMHQDLWSERFEGNGAPDWATKDDGIPFTSLGGFPNNYLSQAVGRSFTNFYANRDGIRDQYKRAWEAVARAVKGKPHALGFDLINEPVCELQVNPPCHIPPDPEAYSRWILPLYDDLIPALRKADPTHPSFYEEGVTVNFGYPMLIGRAPLPAWKHRGAGLSHHIYCSPVFRNAPCSQQEPDAFNEARAAAKRNGAVPLLTEFGATDDLSALRRITGLADKYGEGWQYWQYKTYGDPTTQSSSEAGGSDAESLVSAAGKVKTAKVKLLARAYPSLISGSGAKWTYNARTGRFRMTWRASSRGVTTVEIPRLRFGNDVGITASRNVRSAVALGGLLTVRASGPSTITVKPG